MIATLGFSFCSTTTSTSECRCFTGSDLIVVTTITTTPTGTTTSTILCWLYDHEIVSRIIIMIIMYIIIIRTMECSSIIMRHLCIGRHGKRFDRTSTHSVFHHHGTIQMMMILKNVGMILIRLIVVRCEIIVILIVVVIIIVRIVDRNISPVRIGF